MFGSRQVQKSVSSCTLLNGSENPKSIVPFLQSTDCRHYGHANSQGLEESAQSKAESTVNNILSFEVGNRKAISVERVWGAKSQNETIWYTLIAFDDGSRMTIKSTREISASIECTLKTAPYSKAQRAQDIEQCFADWGYHV